MENKKGDLKKIAFFICARDPGVRSRDTTFRIAVTPIPTVTVRVQIFPIAIQLYLAMKFVILTADRFFIFFPVA